MIDKIIHRKLLKIEQHELHQNRERVIFRNREGVIFRNILSPWTLYIAQEEIEDTKGVIMESNLI
jgi:hypothetical protein